MNRLSQRQLFSGIVLIGLAVALAVLAPGLPLGGGTLILAAAGIAAILLSAEPPSVSQEALAQLQEATNKLTDGKRPKAPSHTPDSLQPVYANLAEVYELNQSLREQGDVNRQAVAQAIERLTTSRDARSLFPRLNKSTSTGLPRPSVMRVRWRCFDWTRIVSR